MTEPIYDLWRYNDWANKILFDVFLSGSIEVPVICIRLMSHIINAQMIWLDRICNRPSSFDVWTEHTLSNCEKYHRISSEELSVKVKTHMNNGPVDVVYTNTQMNSFKHSMSDILLHIFNHGTYHRAQIAMEMRKNGLKPINTDYIAFVRSLEN